VKIRIDIKVKPEEVRTLIGLPDIAGLQDDMIQYIREKMAAGVEGFEPLTLMKQMVPVSIQTAEGLQKAFMKGFKRFAGDEADDQEAEAEPKKRTRRRKSSDD
jgi:hypothetical protein